MPRLHCGPCSGVASPILGRANDAHIQNSKFEEEEEDVRAGKEKNKFCSWNLETLKESDRGVRDPTPSAARTRQTNDA